MKLPRVTSHAMFRYLERAKGIDIDAVRRHIGELCANGASVGAMSVIAEGLAFQLSKEGTVITVTPYTGHPSATKRRQVTEGRS